MKGFGNTLNSSHSHDTNQTKRKEKKKKKVTKKMLHLQCLSMGKSEKCFMEAEETE